MTEDERRVWIVALGQANKSEFDFLSMRWIENG